MPLIHVNDVTYYGDLQTQPLWNTASNIELPTPILNHITLTIRHQETLVVLGESGSGKTSLLKLVAGLYKPHSGDITYNQKPLSQIPRQDRNIGMVFQGEALYTNMTALGNISFHSILKHEEEKIPQRIQDVSRLMNVEIRFLLHRRPTTLSGGEKQRVAIARALARDFSILLFDEPLASLDVKLKQTLRVAMRKVFNDYPVTTLYVTHDHLEAATMADRIVILQKGQVAQIGTPNEVLHKPTSIYVADFWGGCNFIKGRIRDDAQWVYGELKLPAPVWHEGQAVTLGIRPDDVEIDPEGAFEGRVLDAIPLFDRRLQEVMVRMENLTLRFHLPLEVELGEMIRLRPTSLHWFDTASERRI